MPSPRRVLLEPAYLLHHRPWRDSSRVVELHARHHGRVSLFAKGSRRAGSPLAPVLLPFQALLVSWSGPGDGGTLTGAELAGVPQPLPPARLMSGFYLNELVLKLLPRQDPHSAVHDAYAAALRDLRRDVSETRALRLFEKRLLDALGYAIDYAHVAATGEPVETGTFYHVRPQQGVLGVAEDPASTHAYRGADLLALAAEDLAEPFALAAARRLLRSQLDAPLEWRELGTRAVARALRIRGEAARDAGRNGARGAPGREAGDDGREDAK